MPGANARALEKARDIPADGLILDLEDAVAPAVKAEVRDRVCAAVADGRYGTRLVAIRINGIGTDWHEADVRAVASVGPDAVLVPKVNSGADVRQIERVLGLAGVPDRTRLWAMLETPTAVMNAAEISACSERLAVLVMGTNDLANELLAEPGGDRQPLLTSLSLCVLGARAAGKTIIDGVYNNVLDSEGLEAECLQGRQLGFDGKTLIHPGQVEICNRAFSPSEGEVDHARRVIEAFEKAERGGSGVATVDGRLIENLHVDHARKVLKAASGSDGM
jgi:citrate lyase subunit beta / citryl-CoA lyase